MNEQLKIARINARVEREKMLITLLSNPVMSLVLGFTVIELLQKYKIIPETAGTVAEGALVLSTVAPAVAPAIKEVGGVIGPVLGTVTKTLVAKGLASQ
jgi:hypothetical protein